MEVDGSNNLSNCSLTYWETNEMECRQQLADLSNWNMITSLNLVALHNVVDQQLIRFVGMIQDIQNPELFLEKYEMQNTVSKQRRIGCGKYRDIPACGPNEVFVEDSVSNVNKERQPLCCISVPALNHWVRQCHNRSHHSIHPMCEPVERQNKRGHPDESTMNENFDEVSSNHSTNIPDAKRLCPTFQQVSNNSKCNVELSHPLSDTQAVTCLVKVYDYDSSLALNDVIDVVGFLSLNSTTFSEALSSNEEMEEEEMGFHNLPSSLVPRIHAVVVQKLRHSNPLLPQVLSSTDDILKIASSARKELHLILSQVLLGDELAADYFICHLISTVYQRSDLMSLGQFSLNVMNIPSGVGYSEKLYAVLEQLLTKSHYLPLTLDNLNKCSFIPKKDYEGNRLLSGILQLSEHTHLILDETHLEQGQLDTNGVHNIAALGMLISQQKVDYDFQFYKLEFQTDVPVLTLSEGKSILPCDVALPLDPATECLETKDAIFEAVNHFLQEPVLQRLRKYITAVCLLEYSLPRDLEQMIQEDFVRLRRESNFRFSASEFHLLLVLARLMSLSQGEQTLSKDCWKLACRMEQQRKQRISRRERSS